ncbi:MAG: hypothetical protein ACK55I_39795, partial [bacterium]
NRSEFLGQKLRSLHLNDERIKMAKYKVCATRTHEYEVEVEANSEDEAITKLDDWISDDFEDFEVNAKWDFSAMEVSK